MSWNELLGAARDSRRLAGFQPGFAEAPWPLLSSYESVRNMASTAAHGALRAQLAVIKAMHDAGVTIVAGTDYCLPDPIASRLRTSMSRPGCRPSTRLAATAVPAEAMGLSAETGTIEAGKRADLVVLDADPLLDIHKLRTGRWVVAAGRMLDMARLRRAVHFTGAPVHRPPSSSLPLSFA